MARLVSGFQVAQLRFFFWVGCNEWLSFARLRLSWAVMTESTGLLGRVGGCEGRYGHVSLHLLLLCRGIE